MSTAASKEQPFYGEDEPGLSPDLLLAEKGLEKAKGLFNSQIAEELTPLDEVEADAISPYGIASHFEEFPDEDTAEEDSDEWEEAPLEEGKVFQESMDQFLVRAGRYKLLSAAQEVVHSKAIEAGREARARREAYLVSEGDNPSKKLLDAWEQTERQAAEAREVMINSNLRLVVSIVKRYRNQGVALADLVQEGVIGLERAVEKFDWTKGFKFSTYATWWIRQAGQRAVANQSKTIRLPVHVVERSLQIYKAEKDLSLELERQPTVEEIAEYLSMKIEYVQDVKDALQAQPSSLNRYLSDEEETQFGDLIADSTIISPEEETEDNLRAELLRKVVSNLPERERQIIIRRFGLDDGNPKTLEAIGKELGLTRERVRQIEADTLDTLRVLPESQPLND